MNKVTLEIGSAAKLCALCAAEGNSCCQAPLEYAHLFFPLSDAERERLLPFRNLAHLDEKNSAAIKCGEDFLCAEEENSVAFIASMKSLFQGKEKEVERLFPLQGKHKRLRIRANGECIFLNEAGCMLPRSVRPLYCLLFPLWITNGKISYFLAEACLLVADIQSPTDLCKKMDIGAKEVQSLFQQLCEDWDMHLE